MAIGKTKRDRRRNLRRALMRLLTTAVLGLMIVLSFYVYEYLTTDERLAVARVDIEGLSRIDSDEMQRLVADVRGQNILLLPLTSYVARLENHPRVLRAELKRVLPNRVVCTISEREPVALIYTNGFVEVAGDGTIMTSDDLTDLLDLPIVTGVSPEAVKEGRRCTDPDVLAALEILDLCKRHGGRFAEDVSELRVGASGISIVSLEGGMTLLLGDSGYETRLKKFFVMRNAIARSDANENSGKLVDLRFDDQIVLRAGI